MALKACLRFSGLIPRLLLNGNVTPIACDWRRTLSNLRDTRHLHSGCAYVLCANRGNLFRSFSLSSSSESVSYEQLKKLLAAQQSVLIDVREPWELREYGNIPGCINVPVGQVSVALQLEPEEFRERYGGAMPQETDHIVFSCLAGIRSKRALESAISLGYTNAKHYPGGWQEWAELEQLKK